MERSQGFLIHSTPSTFSSVLCSVSFPWASLCPLAHLEVCAKSNDEWTRAPWLTVITMQITENCQKEEWCKSAYHLLSFFTTHLAWFMFWTALKMTLERFGPDKWCRNCKKERIFPKKNQDFKINLWNLITLFLKWFLISKKEFTFSACEKPIFLCSVQKKCT